MSPAPSVAPYPRVLFAALESGVGKTSVSAGLLAALRKRHIPVSAFKCGPDFLDPQVLRRAGNLPSVGNLDLWLTPKSLVRDRFRERALPRPPGLTVVEGVMGLFDTSSWGTSTYDVARLLGIPIVLVVDAARSVESVAAHVRGAVKLLPGTRIAGAIVNHAGPGWHSRTARASIEERARVPVLGLLPWSKEVQLPEKHLGLATPTTEPGKAWSRLIGSLGDWIEENVDLEQVQSIARSAPPLPLLRHSAVARPGSSRRVEVGLAEDAAFCFTYPESIEALEREGARIRRFSPIAGEQVPAGVDAIYLPGGYPELHASAIAENTPFLRELRAWVGDGRPLYAECGGMMILLERLRDLGGRDHRMAGAFPGRTQMTPRIAGFGYGEAILQRPCLWGPPGAKVRGHLYHHSRRTSPNNVPWSWEFHPANGASPIEDGYSRGQALAGYLHVRFDACPGLTRGLLGIDGRGSGPVGKRRSRGGVAAT